MTSRCLVIGVLLLVVADRSASAQVDSAKVKAAIGRGVEYLKSRQDARTGSWGGELEGIYPGGVSSLCTLALLNSGVPLDDPTMVPALQYVRTAKETRRTYSVALETMVLCAAEPDRDRPLIRSNAQWLQRNQVQQGDNAGAWSYSETSSGGGGGDPSNTQFAMLALYEAERAGVEVQDAVWRRSLGYWTRRQHEDGGWSYEPHDPATGSMTCAAVASTIIALGQVTDGDARVRETEVECCQSHADHSIPQRGLEWLSRHFSVSSNPSAATGRNRRFSQQYLFYYLYGVERIGRMTANRFIGQHDWYREGADVLLKSQDPVTGSWKGTGAAETNSDIATALALLFLSKGRRPVVICKYMSGETVDWNRHRSDLAHLTSDVERRWQRELTWQVIDGRAATLEDLLQTPVLYLSGRDGLQLGAEQKQLLKQYVEQGGFIFAESCCNGVAFDRDFRALMAELFPDNELRLLPQDHPIWYAEEKVPAQFLRPLYGIDACCRTSIVYCPGELSCYWELASPRALTSLPPPIQEEVRATLAMGANVLTYATNRELKEKLDAPQLITAQGDQPEAQRGTFYVAKLAHSGGSDDAPAALGNLLKLAGDKLQTRIAHEKRILAPTAEELVEYPIVFMHGRRDFRWTNEERAALAAYVERGGIILADAICASEAFSAAFRREFKLAFPDHPLRPIPPDHPMFTTEFQGEDLRRIRLRNPRSRTESGAEGLATRIEEVAPTLEGMEIDGRFVVILSPVDISCALENQSSIECKGYVREDAFRLGINLLLYAMQQ